MTNTGNDTVKDRGSDFKNITEFNRESSLQYPPSIKIGVLDILEICEWSSDKLIIVITVEIGV